MCRAEHRAPRASTIDNCKRLRAKLRTPLIEDKLTNASTIAIVDVSVLIRAVARDRSKHRCLQEQCVGSYNEIESQFMNVVIDKVGFIYTMKIAALSAFELPFRHKFKISVQVHGYLHVLRRDLFLSYLNSALALVPAVLPFRALTTLKASTSPA